jgi:penicillin-binding protein-related factor A (putative recombinase)
MNKIVYNITAKVRWDILEGWLAWQLEEQIPATLATKLFDDHQFYRLLEQDEEEGPTFVIQFFTSSLERYQQFMIEFAPDFQQKGWNKWGNGFIAFRTLMRSLSTEEADQ